MTRKAAPTKSLLRNNSSRLKVLQLVDRFRIKVIDAEELLKRYAAGERNFAGIDLRATQGSEHVLPYLKRANLKGINLRGSDLYSAYLSGANLSGSDLTGANLLQAHLSGANLRKAILAGTNLRGATLEIADLTLADLESANLTRTILRGANLFQTKLTWAILIETNLGSANNWNRVHIERTFFWKTILPDGTVEIGPIYKSYWDK